MRNRWYRYVDNITASRLSIYDPIPVGNADLWIPTEALEYILDQELRGVSLAGLRLRTRSKHLKARICRAIGYPVPSSFRKTQPRFVGQLFDTYGQKSNNLQIWNEDIDLERRYVIAGIDEHDVIYKVRVIIGEELQNYDTTGTLTQKYQAQFCPRSSLELASLQDTDPIRSILGKSSIPTRIPGSPIAPPMIASLLPISEVFKRLSPLVGMSFADAGIDQERNRGARLHAMVCQALGYANYSDDGKFPDVRNQLLEVKLQMSPTIDLGLVCPNSEDRLLIPRIGSVDARHCDVRYAVFGGRTNNGTVTLTHLAVVTGCDFFSFFRQFQGKVTNKKIQLHLPANFFSPNASQTSMSSSS
ncbi:MAG: restriction endonuclease [Syntrophobacteraceae bacterium]